MPSAQAPPEKTYNATGVQAAAPAAPPPPKWALDVTESAFLLRGMTDREADEQLRDWAVLGTLQELGTAPESLVKATYRQPPVRLRYLDDSFQPQFGTGRYAIVGNDVLLFVDRSDSHATATLLRLADTVRAKMGELPAILTTYTMDWDIPGARIRVWEGTPLDRAWILSPASGYSETVVSDAASFAKWLSAIDDVVLARREGASALRLGGRSLGLDARWRLGLDDVAVLFQAHHKLQDDAVTRAQRRQQAGQQLGDDVAFLGGTLEYKDGEPHAVRSYWSFSQTAIRAAIRRYIATIASIGPAGGEPGFSLDPRWKIGALASALERIAADPCKELRRRANESAATFTAKGTSSALLQMTQMFRPVDVDGTCKELAKKFGNRLRSAAAKVRASVTEVDAQEAAAGAYWQLASAMSDPKGTPSATASLLEELLDSVASTEQCQCARYDGPIQGTRVAMDLFYTDLVAKEWFLDVRGSAPVANVPDFISPAKTKIASTYDDETKKLPGTRVWFGPRREAYSVAPDEATVLLEPVGARVYAAGSNPLNPRAESMPPEWSRRAIAWWDEHYEDVAAYEPEYHRQNEIMKWSVVTAWMMKSSVGLGLSDVPTNHSLRFDRWLQDQARNLTFNDSVPFLSGAARPGSTECLERLSSGADSETILEGGVSLGGKQQIADLPKLQANLEPALRQVATGIEHGAGSATRSIPKYSGSATAHVDPAPGARFRDDAVDLALGALDVQTRRAADTTLTALSSTLASGPAPIGELAIRPGNSVLRMKWEGSMIDSASREVARLAAQPSPDLRTLSTELGSLASPDVSSVAVIDAKTAVVLPRNGTSAIRLTVGKAKAPLARALSNDGDVSAEVVEVGTARALAKFAPKIEIPPDANPQDARALLQEGNFFLAQGNGSRALSLLERAQQLDASPETAAHIAIAKLQSGGLREGQVVLEELPSAMLQKMSEALLPLERDAETRSYGRHLRAKALGLNIPVDVRLHRSEIQVVFHATGPKKLEPVDVLRNMVDRMPIYEAVDAPLPAPSPNMPPPAPAISYVEVVVPDFATHVVLNGHEYQLTDLELMPPPSQAPGMIRVMIRMDCDSNHDGTLSPAECAECPQACH